MKSVVEVRSVIKGQPDINLRSGIDNKDPANKSHLIKKVDLRSMKIETVPRQASKTGEQAHR